MKQIAIGIAVIATLIGTPALAADMAVKAPPSVVAAPIPYSWTGFYVGLNAGAAIGHATQDPTFSAPECNQPGCPPLIAFLSTEQGMNSTVFTGGGQIGGNYQSGRFVFGAEADVEYMPLRHSFAVSQTLPGGACSGSCTIFNTHSSSGSINTDWLVTVRPRVGWAFDRLLVYGTGGLAVTNQRNSLTDIDSVNIRGVIGTFNANSSHDVGWTVGGGLEYAFSNNLSAKVEYLYLNFGNVTAEAGVVGGIGGMTDASVTVTSHLTVNIVRAGLNYKFAY